MISIKSIQPSLTQTKHHHTIFHPRRRINTKNSSFCFCKSNESDSKTPTPEGDSRKQELLARIAMLQTSKVRLTDYLDERSAYLTQFGEEAIAEFDKIGEDALKELDEAGSRIMENIDNRMQEFEESTEMNRQEIEENEYKLADFEDQIEKDRNEGLFFKNLSEKKPVDKAKAKEEMEKIEDLTKKIAESKTRRNIYLGLSGLVAIAIADSFLTSPDWRKVGVLGGILVALYSQITYEQTLLSEAKGKGEQED